VGVASVLLGVLDRLRVASIAQDAVGLAQMYAEDAVHEFPFTTPGGPTRFVGRAAIAEFLAAVYRSLPLRYTEYRTVAVHEVTDTTLVVEQEALGVNTATGARFVLPNIAVIRVDAKGLIVSYRDYANPVAVTAALDAPAADSEA
jgi:ketosteroid isomerase-like protein